MSMQGVYAPSVVEGRDVITYENRLSNLTTNLYKDFNTTLLSYRNASASNALPLLPPAQWEALNKTVNEANTKAKKQVAPKYTQSGETLACLLFRTLPVQTPM